LLRDEELKEISLSLSPARTSCPHAIHVLRGTNLEVSYYIYGIAWNSAMELGGEGSHFLVFGCAT